jgi:2-dehydropantoate 2-reductase
MERDRKGIMQPIKKITVIGAGAMGSVYAAKFFEMDKDCVSLVAKGERYGRLRAQGLTVNDKHYAIPVIDVEEETPPSDLIIVAVKHHHLPEAIQDMKNRVGDHTVILSVMNGIESEEQIGSVYGMERVLYAVSVGIDALRRENRTTFSTQGKLYFGEAENHDFTERVTRIQSLFDGAGIVYETPEDMIRTLWWKFMINVGTNQVATVLRAPFAVLQTSQEARELMESAMREVMAVAEAKKVQLSQADLDNWFSVLSGLSPEGRPSMLQDVEAKRKTEVEMFAGKMIQLGKAVHISVPVNEVFFRIIRVIEEHYD